MLLDSAMMSPSVIRMSGCGSASWIVKNWSTRISHGTSIARSSGITACWTAADAVITLLVEPGSYPSVNARARTAPGFASA